MSDGPSPRPAWRTVGREVTVAEYHCVAHQGTPPFAERHPHTAIAVVRSGTFVYRRGRTSDVLVPGSVVLGNAGDEYVCSHEYGCGDVCLSFQFAPEIVDRFARGGKGRVFERPSLPPAPRVVALARRALAAFDGATQVGVEEAAHLLLDAVVATLREGGSPARREERRAPGDRDRAVAAATFIEERFAEPIDLAVVARQAGLSPFHFLRLFRREMGVTPHQHLIRVRLAKAVERLLDTPAPVTEIALEVGFEDLSNFVRTFHRSVGMPPGEFRRKILQASRAAEA